MAAKSNKTGRFIYLRSRFQPWCIKNGSAETKPTQPNQRVAQLVYILETGPWFGQNRLGRIVGSTTVLIRDLPAAPSYSMASRR